MTALHEATSPRNFALEAPESPGVGARERPLLERHHGGGIEARDRGLHEGAPGGAAVDLRLFHGHGWVADLSRRAGHTLVIDPHVRLWRARSYEDFLTTYTITERTCEIETLTPLYPQMREYRSRED